ncbi:zz domain [Cryptosporidium sp. chipmunk genotype I]|uniref:zz domain n=1 Tax=Cryptosporidium sp. chipmunk genotype I TaxID=1280935 RepID=UPI00351A90EE|nr:zz domain [Cryptosporidium sp. chipmunk genotype I]
MKDLLDSDGESVNLQDCDTLKINEDYKRKYDERKRKEALSKAKELLKNDQEGEDDEDLSYSESDSSDEDEDSDAEFLDFKTQSKILETLDKIKKKDPSIYDNSHVIFSDSSDESDTKPSKSDTSKSSKPMTFRDYERKILLGSQENEDDEIVKKGISKKLGYDKEQDELKKAFLKAAEGLDDSGDELSGTLIKKDKSKEELEEEERNFKSFLTRNIEEGGDPIESLNRYWGPEEDLDENEKFLRNYILNQEWKESNSQRRINDYIPSSYTIQTEIDEEEDEKHLEMSNEFESVYNFRYEEPGANQQIMGYSRNISSLRRPDERRKLKRKEKKERKAEEKLRMEEELKLLKSMKRKEIIEKLKKIQEISGISGISDEKLDLEGDFDPDKHDKYMEELFDDDYNSKKEDLSLGEILENNNEELEEVNNTNIKSRKEAKKQKVKSSLKENQLNDESEVIPSTYNDEDDYEWWQCDSCLKEILPNKKKFDCKVCENFTLCKSCCRNTNHEHPLEKSRVPEPNTKGKGANDSEFTEIDEIANSNRLNLSYGDNEKINTLLDEYYGLHFEDVLDNGKMPVRFKYTKVEKNDYGLSVEDILSMDDKELNQHISLKKLAPYRVDKRRKYLAPVRTSKEAKSSNNMNKRHHNKGNKFKRNYSNDKNSPNLSHINKHRLESYY